jgi:hypothetical protein
MAGAILYRSLVGAASTPTLITQLVELVLDGRLPRLPADAQ